MVIPIVEIRRSYGFLIPILMFIILTKLHMCTETGPYMYFNEDGSQLSIPYIIH